MSSKFVVGVEVAVDGRYEKRPTKHKVGKVYKNGNFTLEGDESCQQYRPYGDKAVLNYSVDELVVDLIQYSDFGEESMPELIRVITDWSQKGRPL
jgi:hypothetical protein